MKTVYVASGVCLVGGGGLCVVPCSQLQRLRGRLNRQQNEYFKIKTIFCVQNM